MITDNDFRAMPCSADFDQKKEMRQTLLHYSFSVTPLCYTKDEE